MTILLICLYAALLIMEVGALILSVIFKQRFSIFACLVYIVVTIMALVQSVFLK